MQMRSQLKLFALSILMAAVMAFSQGAIASDTPATSPPAAGMNSKLTNADKKYEAYRLSITANRFLASGNLTAAIQSLQEAIKVNPDDAQLHAALMYCLTETGKPDQAIEEGRTAVKLNPDEPIYWRNLASACQEAGKINDAAEALTEFLQRFPHDDNRSLMKARLAALKHMAHEQAGRSSVPGLPENFGQLETSKKWRRNKMPLHVYIADGTKVDGYRDDFRTIMQQSFESWANCSNGRISFLFADSPRHCDIKCVWTASPSHLSNKAEGGEARVTVDSNGGIENVQIIVLTKLANCPDLSDDQIKEVTLHEIGHALGLSHSFKNTDVMFHTEHPQPLTNLSEGDKATIVQLYSQSNPDPIPVACPTIQFVH